MPNPQKRATVLENLRFKVDIDETIGTGLVFYEQHPDADACWDRIDSIKAYIDQSTMPEVEALKIMEFKFEVPVDGDTYEGYGFHILHPGSIEYGKWMYQLGMNFDLFSAGIKERNEVFFREFITLVVTSPGHGLQNLFSVYNRENCFSPESENIEEMMSLLESQARQYGIPIPKGYAVDPVENLREYASAPKKRLESINVEDWEMILVDNNIYNIYPGEEKQSLITNSTLLPEDFCIDFENQNKSITLRQVLLLNNVFGIVGVKKTVLDMTVENGKSFSDNLFSLQFNHTDEVSIGYRLFPTKDTNYTPVDFFSPERFKFFEIGLKELQKINPDLQFYGQDLLYQLMNEYKQKQEQQNYYARMGV